MRVQTEATRVLERTSHYIKAGIIRQKPAWYDAVAAVPPTYNLNKKAKNLGVNQQEDPQNQLWQKNYGIYKTRASQEDKKLRNNHVNRVPKLEFLEDQLRDVFYHQHPWEFTRPKTLVETDGRNNENCDWSHMLQLSKALDGESVVQRTLWLLQAAKAEVRNMTLFDAYDQARFEFYKLRMAEETESAVAKEEASMFGCLFASTNLQWGIEKEQEIIDEWVKAGETRTKVKEAALSKASASVGISRDGEEKANMWESFLAAEEENIN